MDLTNKIVTKIPITELWNSELVIATNRNQYLLTQDVNELLKILPFQFVIADVGLHLKWINKEKCFNFWKTVAKNHIVDNIKKIELAICPDNYAFIASKWITDQQDIIVLLEKLH